MVLVPSSLCSQSSSLWCLDSLRLLLQKVSPISILGAGVNPSPKPKTGKGSDNKHLININSTFLSRNTPGWKNSTQGHSGQWSVLTHPLSLNWDSLSCRAGGPEDLASCLLSDGISIALLPHVTDTSFICFSQYTEGPG